MGPRASCTYGILIGSGVSVMVALAGFSVWRDYQAKQRFLSSINII